ncbi:peptidase dimerization domain-containing protein [Erwinia sp. S59]|nr:peptidase dimerization domain-containing protein [Erwinia sp. S59]
MTMTGQTHSTQRFHITLTGKGAHAARPHEGIDVIVIGSHIVSALYALPNRHRQWTLGITRLTAGNSWNVLPQTAEIEGIVRSHDKYTDTHITTLIAGIAAGFGAETHVNWQPLSASEPDALAWAQ